MSEQSSTNGPPEGYNADGTILQPIEEDGTLSTEGYGSISVAASVAASTAQATPKKLPPWLNSHSVRQSVPISTPASATRNTAEVWLPQGTLSSILDTRGYAWITLALAGSMYEAQVVESSSERRVRCCSVKISSLMFFCSFLVVILL